ncbi:uncharacterized protein (TIGR00725 family) [Bradyrhizobium japonicum]|uniref:SLOG cluster 4 domain-containing protein n=1 Tax=Bradyrhizobium japonicum TaxID=375 RepID=UPI002169A533|nr:hypothetical protein [Bradyrhizobium japonicum]MCS3499350.1 uncharacterized protein (TIGR00725 family) [Bradyrhizobium japonicum]MCS3958486.1 uncharacterized protein (TIGR00725 family) [Bradyrhizobium japonicum]MCS4000240.1 uncharacterized protein (TIGR00725 family) [Bradyrhizobium japonicum]
MSRKFIVAVIGGNGLPDVASSAHRFCALLSNRVVLLTGGAPDGRLTDVKNAAMAGSQGAKGLMVSVLPRESPSCELQGRRLILKTGLGKYERDAITGSAADVVVVFSGGAGTLVELAYAAFQNRPIIFQSSVQYLRAKCSLEVSEVKKGFAKAKDGYPLISTKEGDLEHALGRCLANPHDVDTPEEAAQRVFGLLDGVVPLQDDTRFLGLPNDKEGHWKKKFNLGVAELSKL